MNLDCMQLEYAISWSQNISGHYINIEQCKIPKLKFGPSDLAPDCMTARDYDFIQSISKSNIEEYSSIRTVEVPLQLMSAS